MLKNELRSRVTQYAALRGIKIKDVATRAGMAPATLYTRLRNQGDIRVDELNAVCAALKMTEHDQRDLVGALFNINMEVKQ